MNICAAISVFNRAIEAERFRGKNPAQSVRAAHANGAGVYLRAAEVPQSCGV